MVRTEDSTEGAAKSADDTLDEADDVTYVPQWETVTWRWSKIRWQGWLTMEGIPEAKDDATVDGAEKTSDYYQLGPISP